MKRIVLATFMLLITANLSLAVETRHSNRSLEDMDRLLQKKNELVEKISKAKTTEKKGGIETEQRFDAIVATLRDRFPTLKSDKIKKKISHDQKTYLKGVARNSDDIQVFKDKAIEFLIYEVPDVLGSVESLKILYVAEDHGAEQEKDEDGNILPDVWQKTYSYTVRVGRELLGNPLFNSSCAIEFDAATEEMAAFKLTNWFPISLDKVELKGLKKLSKEKIQKRIQDRYDTQELNPDICVDSVMIYNIVQGLFIEENKRIVPAFIHYGVVEATDTRIGESFTEKCVFLEKLTDDADPSTNETDTFEGEEEIRESGTADKAVEEQPAKSAQIPQEKDKEKYIW